MHRREFLKKAAALAGAAFVENSLDRTAAQAQAPPLPNVLFILCDQWRAQALSSAGDPNVRAPNVDAMAAAGARLTHCYSNSPLCTPCRSMLMSGRYPTRTNCFVNDVLMPLEEYCVAEAFRDAGYSTGYIGKWHLDGDPKPGYVEPGPHRQGWDYWAAFNRGHDYFSGVYYEDSPTPISVPSGKFEPDHQTDLAINWIAGRVGETAPWFLTVSFGPPHTPYRAPQAYMDLFDPAALILRPNVSGDVTQARTDLRGYYALIKNLDDNIGRLLQCLSDNGLADDTVVVLTADHGDMHYSQGQVHKSKPWEESIGVPFIVRWPGGLSAGRVVDSLFASIDIHPTLCGLCGVPIPPGKDGADYSHLLRGLPGPERQSVYLTIGLPSATSAWRGVRTAQYTYAWKGGVSGAPWVLYDNFADPYQMNNLAADPGSQALRDQLHYLLRQWVQDVGDSFFGPPSGVENWRTY